MNARDKEFQETRIVATIREDLVVSAAVNPEIDLSLNDERDIHSADSTQVPLPDLPEMDEISNGLPS